MEPIHPLGPARQDEVPYYPTTDRQQAGDVQMRTIRRHGERVALEHQWLAPACRQELAPTTAACCCPAPAVYQVVMPPSDAHSNLVEILLCGHHYRVNEQKLFDEGAAVYDMDGRLIRW